MAEVKNISAGAIAVTASRSDLNGDAPFDKTIAAGATETVPDAVARLPEIAALVTAAKLEIVSWDDTDGSGVGQAEIKALMSTGTGTLTSGTTSVIADVRVKTGSKIFIQGLDTEFAALAVWHDAASLVDVTSFTLDHANAAGTEAFDYLIIDPSHV